MKFVYSFVFSHSCRCVLVYSFHRLHCPDADCALPPMWHPVSLQSRAVRCAAPAWASTAAARRTWSLASRQPRKSGPKCWRCDVMLKGVSLRQTERHPFSFYLWFSANIRPSWDKISCGSIPYSPSAAAARSAAAPCRYTAQAAASYAGRPQASRAERMILFMGNSLRRCGVPPPPGRDAGRVR